METDIDNDVNRSYSRLYGLLSDHMLSADIALANGEIVRASEYNHPDLFWVS
jgi:FAD/FMN-containing dehydrogenase